MIPLTVGMLIAGPMSGILSDRYGARPFATGGMLGAAICFALLEAAARRLLHTGSSVCSCSSPACPWRLSAPPTGPG
jgi:MFS family permease